MMETFSIVWQVHERCSHQPWLSRCGLRWCPGQEGTGYCQEVGCRKFWYDSITSLSFFFKLPFALWLLQHLYFLMSLSSQCFGEEGKVSTPSSTPMLLLSWSTWPASSKWLLVSVSTTLRLIKSSFGMSLTITFTSVSRLQREDWTQVSVSYWTQT